MGGGVLVGGYGWLVGLVAAPVGRVMIHERCRTFFNAALIRRCQHCGMLWCPRCRTWFWGAAQQIGEVS